MSVAEVAGWLGTVLVLGGYAASIRRSAPRWLHLGNAVGCLGTGWSALAVGAWPNLALTLTFGALGWWGLLRRPKRRGPTVKAVGEPFDIGDGPWVASGGTCAPMAPHYDLFTLGDPEGEA